MLRRLYFLFPDEKHAQLTVDQLLFRKIPLKKIHAITKGIELKTLPKATERQKNDTAFQIEQFLWKVVLAKWCHLEINTFWINNHYVY